MERHDMRVSTPIRVRVSLSANSDMGDGDGDGDGDGKNDAMRQMNMFAGRNSTMRSHLISTS